MSSFHKHCESAWNVACNTLSCARSQSPNASQSSLNWIRATTTTRSLVINKTKSIRQLTRSQSLDSCAKKRCPTQDGGGNVLLITLVPKVYKTVLLFVGSTTSCNSVYQHWIYTSIYRPLSYPYRSLSPTY